MKGKWKLEFSTEERYKVGLNTWHYLSGYASRAFIDLCIFVTIRTHLFGALGRTASGAHCFPLP